MPRSISPFLMFQGDGVAALDFYLSVFPDAVVERDERYGEDAGERAGTLQMAQVRLAGLTLLLNDSPPVHDFTFTPSMSLFLECACEAEARHLGEVLKQGGSEMMPLANYGFSTLFAWVSDRFGVSWQINLK